MSRNLRSRNEMTVILKKYFGHSSFRPGQQEAISTLIEGHHLLAIMPTGSGKSLIYQCSGLLREGITLVISPLISLMKDQVDKLNQRGIPATFINSTISNTEQLKRLDLMVKGEFKLVYVAPERLRQYFFREEIIKLKVGLLTVDEAHCLSQWGHDFRPDYLHISAFRKLNGDPVTAAFTATATNQVRKEIAQLLGISKAKHITHTFDRPNIKLEVISLNSVRKRHEQKLAVLSKLFQNWQHQASIVYVATRRDAEIVAWFLREKLGLPAQHYHGGMETYERNSIQDEFISKRLPIVVATNAFGMGIDRPDVRLVIHYTIPGSLEAYYQEVGRAGRDGKPARAILLYNSQDRDLQEFFIDNSYLRLADLSKLYTVLQSNSDPNKDFWINPNKVSQLCHFDDEGVQARVGLQRLEEAGVIEQVYYQGIERLVRLYKWDIKAINEIVVKIDKHYARRREQLANMIDYAENARSCRRRLILRYFGEELAVKIGKRCCDICDERKERVAFIDAIKQETKLKAQHTSPPSVSSSIVACVKRFSGLRTEEQIIQILHGDLQGYSIYRESEFHGILSKYKAKQIKTEISQLLESGILIKDEKGSLVYSGS